MYMAIMVDLSLLKEKVLKTLLNIAFYIFQKHFSILNYLYCRYM